MPADGRIAVTPSQVRRLIAAQFPKWAGLPVVPVATPGWDNHSFRLGTALKVRLPSAAGYVPQVAKEARWLPDLAARLPVAIPVPVAVGAPGEGYPWPWSVQAWIDGETAAAAGCRDATFAADVAAFLRALQALPPTGPEAGAQSFHRGGSLAVYDGDLRASVATLGARIDAGRAIAVWEAALAAPWRGPPVWLHGDVAAGNLLVRDGRLVAVIDWGCAAVGDPACDLVLAWTFLAPEARAEFRAAVAADADTWARARGWALWKALLTAAAGGESAAGEAAPLAIARAAIAG